MLEIPVERLPAAAGAVPAVFLQIHSDPSRFIIQGERAVVNGSTPIICPDTCNEFDSDDPNKLFSFADTMQAGICLIKKLYTNSNFCSYQTSSG